MRRGNREHTYRIPKNAVSYSLRDGHVRSEAFLRLRSSVIHTEGRRRRTAFSSAGMGGTDEGKVIRIRSMAAPYTSPVPSLPLPCPKSPPQYPDLYGKRRELLKVRMIEREIGFLEDELKSLEDLPPASRRCKEVDDFVGANPDPLIPADRKIRRSRRIWKWLCGKSCFNLSWICCSSNCSLHVEPPSCCACHPSGNLLRCHCFHCCHLKRISCSKCCILPVLSCSDCCSCCRCTCFFPKCTKLCYCPNCTKTWCNSCLCC